MSDQGWLRAVRSERGVALPMAMILLALLSALMIAAVVLATSEPTISASHSLGLQARAQAEAGVERAFWALTKKVITTPTAPAPYNGGTYMPLGNGGGYFVTVTAGGVVNERTVDTIGWAPTNLASVRSKANRHLRLTATTILFNIQPPPAALSVRGNVTGVGNFDITTQNDSSCGQLPGVITTGTQEITYNGGGGIQGNPGQVTNDPTSDFDKYILTDADLNGLKALAKSSGTYLQGNQSFNASNRIPKNGLVFVDTVGGANIACTPSCTPPASQIPIVTIGANAQPTGSTAFSGMLIVNGSLVFSGAATQINGMVYAQDTISVNGSVAVSGAVMARNITSTVNNLIAPAGDMVTIDYNCANAKGAGVAPTAWFVKPGTYREVSN